MHTARSHVAGLATLSAVGLASAAPFSIFENFDGVSTTHLAIDVDAYQAQDAIDFVITNTSAGPGVLTSLVIENTPTSSRLGPLSIIGASWSIDANASPPGSVSNHGAWAGTLTGVLADPSRVRNGLSAGDSLTLRFALGELEYAEAFRAFSDREFRLVGHIQSIGDSSVWGVSVPAPGSLALLGAGGLVATRRRH